ncbi:MAG: radical SAM protein [Solirubrobacterales bacterium]
MGISIWTTGSCNFSCKYCYEQDKVHKHMSKTTQEKILLWIKKAYVNKEINIVNFHGGEPFLNFDCIKYMTKHILDISPNTRFSVTTNGSIWNKDIGNFFYQNRDKFDITISIDGSQKYHDANRITSDGIGTFSKVIENLKYIGSTNINLRCRMTVTPNNIEALHNNIEFIKSLGIKTIVAGFDQAGDWDSTHIEIIENEFKHVIENYNPEENIRVSIIDNIKTKKCLGKCRTTMHFYVDENIYPCIVKVGKYDIGNLCDGINNQKIKEIERISENDNPNCIGCSNINHCTGNRCKLINQEITNEYYNPPPIVCALENINIKLAKVYL